MSRESASTDGPTPQFLTDLRDGGTRQLVVLVVVAAVGVGLAWVHWVGLVVAGALVGLVSSDLPRAVLAGFLVGVVVLLANLLAVPTMGPGEFLGLAPASYVTVAAALVAPVWGSLVRGVI